MAFQLVYPSSWQTFTVKGQIEASSALWIIRSLSQLFKCAIETQRQPWTIHKYEWSYFPGKLWDGIGPLAIVCWPCSTHVSGNFIKGRTQTAPGHVSSLLVRTGLRHKASGSKGTEVLPLNHGILGKISPFTITRSVPSLNHHKQNKMFIDDGQMHLQWVGQAWVLHHELGALWWVSVSIFSSTSLTSQEFSPAYYSSASPTSRPSVLCCMAMTLLHCHHNVLNQSLKMDSVLVSFLNKLCLLPLRDTTTCYKNLGLNISYSWESWGWGHRMEQNSNLYVRKSAACVVWP